MDKNTFLKELERSLSVLQEDEIRDIISEYEQHIDMKVQNGQTEEQAIADFGSLSELTADILEAYHVRADYAEKKEKRFSFAEGEKAGQELLQQTGEVCRKTGGGLIRLIQRLGRGLKRISCRIGSCLAGAAGACRCRLGRAADWLRAHRKQRNADLEAGKQMFAGEHRLLAGAYEEHSRRREKAGGFMNGITKGAAAFAGGCAGMITGAFHFCMRVFAWSIRVCWNMCWGGFALCCVMSGLLCLFGLGMLAVLWMQHYPLAGVTIGCLGLVLCFFSAAGYAVTLLWRTKKKQA